MVKSRKLGEALKTRVEDITVNDFPSADKDQSIAEALRLMEKYGTDRIVVTEKGAPIGVMTKKDLVNKLLMERTRTASFSALHISSFFTNSTISVEASKYLSDAAKEMEANDISSLFVEKLGSIRGFFTKRELVGKLADVDDVRALEVMSPVVHLARLDERLLHIRQLMLSKRVYFMPVVSDSGKLVGTISIDDIADAVIQFYRSVPERYRREKKHKLFVHGYYNRTQPVAGLDTKLSEIVGQLVSKGVRGVVVMEGDNVKGQVTIDDITRLVALGSHEVQRREQ